MIYTVWPIPLVVCCSALLILIAALNDTINTIETAGRGLACAVTFSLILLLREAVRTCILPAFFSGVQMSCLKKI